MNPIKVQILTRDNAPGARKHTRKSLHLIGGEGAEGFVDQYHQPTQFKMEHFSKRGVKTFRS